MVLYMDLNLISFSKEATFGFVFLYCFSIFHLFQLLILSLVGTF